MHINGIAKSARVARGKGERKEEEARRQKSGLFSDAILADLIYVLSSVVSFLFPVRGRKRRALRHSRERQGGEHLHEHAPMALETR